MLKTKDARPDIQGALSLNRAEMPYIKSLLKLFAPLIEVECGYDVDNGICRLYHWTVFNFLCKNTQLLSHTLTAGPKEHTARMELGPQIIADACLLYLSQPRYSRLLSKSSVSCQWLDVNGDPAADHQFLTYSAKYWDKHLDCSHGKWPLDPNCKGFVALQSRVEAFLNSSNFQTCIQVQSLWVDSHFGIYGVRDSPFEFVKRVLPDWLLSGNTDWQLYKNDYRNFWYEWKLFLNCGTSDGLPCATDPYVGEVDRCWWAALGRKNFLSKMQSRYITFRLELDENYGPERRYGFEGVSAAGDEFITLKLK